MKETKLVLECNLKVTMWTLEGKLNLRSTRKFVQEKHRPQESHLKLLKSMSLYLVPTKFICILCIKWVLQSPPVYPYQVVLSENTSCNLELGILFWCVYWQWMKPRCNTAPESPGQQLIACVDGKASLPTQNSPAILGMKESKCPTLKHRQGEIIPNGWP